MLEAECTQPAQATGSPVLAEHLCYALGLEASTQHLIYGCRARADPHDLTLPLRSS